MNERLRQMYENTRMGAYRAYRRGPAPNEAVRERFAAFDPFAGLPLAFAFFLEAETPIIVPGDRFYFTRSSGTLTRYPWEGTSVQNLTADWELLLAQGLAGRIRAAETKLREPGLEDKSRAFLQGALAMMRAVIAFSHRYADAAAAAGDEAGAALLRKVPENPPETLYEALQSLFFMFSMLQIAGVTQLGWGRMDQYLDRFYRADLEAGRLTRAEAEELFVEFFMMLNRENDIYGLAQQGDDGESLMLGGCRRDGSDGVNDLTLLLLETASETSMINPKINLRVDSHTPQYLLEAGVRLTRRGLGFPQYCNDEVIVPALAAFGYPLEDARDYTVAACWEFVVRDGRDVPNRTFINLSLATDKAIRRALRENASFEELTSWIVPAICEQFPPMPKDPPRLPQPLFSALSGACIERGRDIHFGGGRHYHYGCLGSGSSSAADSLAAVKRFVYEEKSVAPAELLAALENDYAGAEALRETMRSGPKVGDDTPESNEMLKTVFDALATACETIKDNGLGGRMRPGTGSAHGYALLTRTDHRLRVGATADGRHDGDYFSASLSPSPGVRAAGILSLLKIYGQLDYRRLCNGGPITMEFAPAYFRSEDAIARTTEFVRAFVRAGCQQLQMNVLDHAVLRDAQIHPERHRDLIVRVWGWSGYFVELDKLYQDQIIGRCAYGE